MEGLIGEAVRFEFVSADATTAAVITIYDNEGNARPLAATERLVITDIHASAVATMVVDVYAGVGASPGNGERLFNFNLAATIGPAYPSLNNPAYSKKGVTPKVKASAAGAFTVLGQGTILRA